MKLRFTFSLLLYSILMFSQTNDAELVAKHRTFFKTVKDELSTISSNDSALAYLELKKNVAQNDYVLMRLKTIEAGFYKAVNQNKGLVILDEVNTYLNKHPGYTHLNIHHNIVKGKFLYDLGKFSESLSLYSQFEDLVLNDTSSYWNYKYETKIGITSNLVALGHDEKAIQQLKELELQIDRETQLDEYIYTQNMLGYLHTKSRNFKDGERYFLNIINVLEAKNDLGNAYLGACNNLGYIYKVTSEKDKAIQILKKALRATKRLGLLDRELLLSVNLGFLLIDKERYEEAEELGVLVIEKSRDKFDEKVADGNRLLANVYYYLGFNQKALEHADKAISFFRKINDLKRLKSSLAIKNKVLISTKDFEAATLVNSEMISIMDSISLSVDLQNLQKTLVAFESEKKDNTITILQQKEAINTFKIEKQQAQIHFLIFGVIILFALGLIVFLFQKKINTIKNLVLRSKLTRSQFNPHYINNAFTTLQAELMERDFDEQLIDYTSSVSRFSRLLLESTFAEEWTIYEETQMIENYLKTQQYRLQNGFDFSVQTNLKNDEFHKLKIPSAITQTVLENAIEHSGFEHNGHGKIHISIEKQKSSLYIWIQNDIVPVKTTNLKAISNLPSRGLKITEQRMELHGKIHKKETNFNFIQEDTYAKVSFELPIIAA